MKFTLYKTLQAFLPHLKSDKITIILSEKKGESHIYWSIFCLIYFRWNPCQSILKITLKFEKKTLKYENNIEDWRENLNALLRLYLTLHWDVCKKLVKKSTHFTIFLN